MVITTTELWMFGIIGMMILFGICAGVFSKLGNNKNS